MIEIKSEEFNEYGITISGNQMDNGELRFRLTGPSSSYIRTESKEETDWQNSHYHTEQTEYFLIERGSVQFAIMEGEEVIVKEYHSGDLFVVPPMIPHNMKLIGDCVTHTLKLGGSPDWVSCSALDEHLRNS